MTLDLSKPEHREALKWACESNRQSLNQWLKDGSLLDDKPALYAARTLSDPTLTAEVLRGLLEGCRVDVAEFNPRSMHRVKGGADEWEPIVGWGAEEDRWHGVGMARLPALLLAILAIPADAPDARKRALAALRGAG